MNPEVLQRALEREKARRAKAERLLEEKSRELYLSHESLQESNVELEHALKEVNSQQRQLVQSEKMASLGVMSAGIAHEINNPLAFVHSNIDSLEHAIGKITQYHEHVTALLTAESDQDRLTNTRKLDSFVKESDLVYLIEDCVDLIAETTVGVSRVKAIVTGLQSFAHSESGVMARFDLHDCIHSTVRVAHNQIKSQAEVQLDFGELPEIMGYPGKLEQVILNLLVNASHSMVDQQRDEPGTIKIKTSAQTDTVTIAVTDNGCGMDQSTIDSVFMPFFTTKEVGEGTGLGMAISHGIIEEHRGSIGIESTPGVGTTFTLTLPITSAESQAA